MTTIDTQIQAEIGRRHRHISFHELVTAGLARISELLIALMDWQYRARERRQLLGLSDAALKDFGANRADAESEGDKPF